MWGHRMWERRRWGWGLRRSWPRHAPSPPGETERPEGCGSSDTGTAAPGCNVHNNPRSTQCRFPIPSALIPASCHRPLHQSPTPSNRRRRSRHRSGLRILPSRSFPTTRPSGRSCDHDLIEPDRLIGPDRARLATGRKVSPLVMSRCLREFVGCYPRDLARSEPTTRSGGPAPCPRSSVDRASVS